MYKRQFSQIASLLVTFLLIPMLSSKIKSVNLRNKALSFILIPFDKLLNLFYRVYERALRFVLSHRKSFMFAVLIIFAASIFTLTKLGLELFTMPDEGSISVSVELPAGSRLEDTDALSREIEEKIKEHPAAETVFSNIGSSGLISLSSGENTSTISVTLSDDRQESTDDVAQDIRDMLKDVTGAVVEVSASSASMSVSTNELSYAFSSTDEDALEEYVLKAEEVLKGIDGVSETSTSISETQSELKINVDTAKAAKYGLTTSAVSSYVKSVLDGITASTYTEGGSEYDINVVYPEDYLDNYIQLNSLQIKSAAGQWVTLGDIAEVTVEQGSTTLMRMDQKRVITLSGVLHDTDMGTANNAFEEAIAGLDMPDGISREATGSYEMMIDAMVQFIIAILLGILLMYMVMAAQFENMRQPFIILFTVPLSIIGVALSLVITNSSLSVLSFVGMLMLIGIIVNNAIILIDFINIRRAEKPDMPRTEAIVDSGLTRMRPILMTTITSVIGFLPMAISGSEMMRPLAVVLVGGLSVGALLTLLVIPVVYSIMDDRSIKKKAKKERRAARRELKRSKAQRNTAGL